MAVAFGVIPVTNKSNRVFLRLAARNVVRRRGRSALIVGGLMLATAIIASSLVTGDTMARTIRSSVLRSLGATDETVVPAGAKLDPALQVDASATQPTFDQRAVTAIDRAVAGSALVDGVAPAMIRPVAAQDRTSRRNEPRVTLFGPDAARLAGFGRITGHDGRVVSLAALGASEVFLNQDAADKLAARPGDRVLIFGGATPVDLRVADVVHLRGAGTDGPAVLAPLPLAQRIVGAPGRISHILVSNAGGETSGVGRTDAVRALIGPAAARAGLRVIPAKRDGLRQADQQGSALLQLFSTFGTFAIAAGILLIFLIFVMLAAERRTEMGIARAVGTQRRHLVETFVFEGSLYDLAAAAVGALAGLGIAYAMVATVARAFSREHFVLEHAVRPASLVDAYGLGVVLTLVVVAVSAWRVSVLDVVAAIRNLPSPAAHRTGRARWWPGAAAVAAGAAMAAAGASSHQATSFLLGVSLVIVGLVPIARALGAPDRAVHTVAGLALVVWWLLPAGVYNALVGTLNWDFSVWIVAGLIVVFGATWVIMYNADLALAAVSRATGRIRS